MNLIRVWHELLDSDLPLNGEDVVKDLMYHEFAIIEQHSDSKLRIDYGAVLLSVIHEVDGVPMLVVLENKLVLSSPDQSFGHKPYVKTGHAVPHYHTANSFGLIGNHRNVNVHSVLVPINKLDQIEFTTTPEPLRQWERDLLSFMPTQEEMRIICTSLDD